MQPWRPSRSLQLPRARRRQAAAMLRQWRWRRTLAGPPRRHQKVGQTDGGSSCNQRRWHSSLGDSASLAIAAAAAATSSSACLKLPCYAWATGWRRLAAPPAAALMSQAPASTVVVVVVAAAAAAALTLPAANSQQQLLPSSACQGMQAAAPCRCPCSRHSRSGPASSSRSSSKTRLFCCAPRGGCWRSCTPGCCVAAAASACQVGASGGRCCDASGTGACTNHSWPHVPLCVCPCCCARNCTACLLLANPLLLAAELLTPTCHAAAAAPHLLLLLAGELDLLLNLLAVPAGVRTDPALAPLTRLWCGGLAQQYACCVLQSAGELKGGCSLGLLACLPVLGWGASAPFLSCGSLPLGKLNCAGAGAGAGTPHRSAVCEPG